MGKKMLLLMGFLSLTMGWFFPVFPILFVGMLIWHVYTNYIAPSPGGPGGYGGFSQYTQPSSLLGSLFGGYGRMAGGGGGGMASDAPPPYNNYHQQSQHDYKQAAPAASGGGFLPAALSGAAAGYMLGRRSAPAPAQPQYPNLTQFNSGGPTVLDAGEPTHTSTSYATTKRR